MESSSLPSNDPTPPKVNSSREKMRHFPQEVQEAFRTFEATRNPDSLDPVILAILDDYIPKKTETPLATFPGTTRLIEDLGFDSLAITEVVFFSEELLNISIGNEELMQVRTLDDLRGFIRKKVSPPSAA